jgi:hypothetical protein
VPHQVTSARRDAAGPMPGPGEVRVRLTMSGANRGAGERPRPAKRRRADYNRLGVHASGAASKSSSAAEAASLSQMMPVARLVPVATAGPASLMVASRARWASRPTMAPGRPGGSSSTSSLYQTVGSALAAKCAVMRTIPSRGRLPDD